jgi:hypothetical protein
MCHTPMRAGVMAQAASVRATSGRGQRWMSHAASSASATHMTWKYLFMSNSTALATTVFGTMNIATAQQMSQPRAGSFLVSRASAASTSGMPRFVT